MNNMFDLGNRQFKTTDAFPNNRTAIIIDTPTDVRKSLRDLNNILFSSDNPCEILRNNQEGFVLEILDNKDNYSAHDSTYDCRNWVFDKVGLPHYTWRDGGNVVDKLMDEDFSDISWVSKPEKNAVVMYFSSFGVRHWGVVDDISDDIYVASKWGNGHVYRHLLCDVPPTYGDHASFFKVGS
jgi:hypothetical protein